MPYAARGDLNDQHQRHEAYGNNKLAQILHAKEVTKRSESEHVEMIAVCPGWVSTNILPDNFIGKFIKKRAFKAKDGALAGICALLGPQLSGGEFVTNYRNFWLEQSWTPLFFRMLTVLKIRSIAAHILSIYVLLSQKYSYKCHISTSSPESYDESLAAQLYDWSMSVTSKWRSTSE